MGGTFSWRDLRTLISRWGGLPGTALFRSVHGYEGWTTESHLLALVVDYLAVHDYHFAKANGAKNARPPKPLERPGDKPKSRYGSGAMPFDEIDAWMKSTWK